MDDATSGWVAYYMINCAHPTHFESVLAEGGAWRRRIRGLRANASRLSHQELNALTTLDDDLRRVMEPRTSRPVRRLAAIEKLANAGIPVGVMTAPVIPGLTDHELPNLLSAAAVAGATFAGYVPVRLPGAVAPLFEDWLGRHFPDRKEKVLNRVRSMRGGGLNDPRYGSRMKGEGVYAEHLSRLFGVACRRAGIERGRFPKLSTAAFRRDGGVQPGLFD